MEETQRKRKGKNNKKRFSDEQIRSLEAIFESETKLEPRKKAQLARELGLQPRQVAIWFQNRRARWRSKQIEGEYKVLKANYDHLASQFEFLAKEKQSLLMQLKKLTELSEKHQGYGNRNDNKSIEVNKIDGSSQNREARLVLEAKRPIFLQEMEPTGQSTSSRQDHARNKGNIGPYGDQEVTMSTDCSLEKLCNLESTSGGLIDQQPPGNLHWWNIWT